ncbi:putative ribonuclease VapC protein [Halorhabdus tiamatea SARL4B]|uniref:Putative ribonuclease VapC protein n=1 Tax=Halorhabdus tiamatea SARL4B TaxID=1033806 RepID=F7PHC8_9EURY|nr:PIN domain-containing protein [Halorhabdus tiamatea]ERJ04753.1 putative ribonuclease VapC protein [Halorhabdus tiamatea SARL4B]
MTTAVDTNALIALLYEDEYAGASEKALRRAYQEGRVVVAPIVYAELAADGHFDTTDDLNRFLDDFSIQLVEPSREALFEAGKAFQRYTERRPDGLQCPSCGAKQSVTCEQCDTALSPRQHIAADFIIGGHASVDADSLVSFDEGFYNTYFSSLTVLPDLLDEM